MIREKMLILDKEENYARIIERRESIRYFNSCEKFVYFYNMKGTVNTINRH